jgi:hypothetical protein
MQDGQQLAQQMNELFKSANQAVHDAAEQLRSWIAPHDHHATRFSLLLEQTSLNFGLAASASGSDYWVTAVFRFKENIRPEQNNMSRTGEEPSLRLGRHD